MKLYKKLFEIQKKHLAVSKDAKNPFFKSQYVTLDNLVSTLTPYLDEQKLLVFHKTEDWFVKTIIADVEWWETIESCFPLIDLKDPQKLWSVISYAKRYNLWQLFNIITDRDDDWEEARVEVAKPKLKTMTKENYAKFQEWLNAWKFDWKNIEDVIKSTKAVYDISVYEDKMREDFTARQLTI